PLVRLPRNLRPAPPALASGRAGPWFRARSTSSVRAVEYLHNNFIVAAADKLSHKTSFLHKKIVFMRTATLTPSPSFPGPLNICWKMSEKTVGYLNFVTLTIHRDVFGDIAGWFPPMIFGRKWK
ncbi:MAG: hypothetical protein LBH21_01340, partial [Gracilibacteraceae bacterium]|nr:hypothetical protein [Gracilibacteraceae bacterium]